MRYPEDFINKIICIDSPEGMKNIPDNSVDLMSTDPPYGYSFMGRDWDKALVSIRTWKECLRVLKPGAFAFIMCAPRQDVLSRQIINLEEAGFMINFTPIFWAMASGFPKAQNCAKVILKKFLQVSLQDVSRFPDKDEDSQSDSHCRFCGGLLQSGLVIFRDVSPLQDDALKYNHLSSPSVDIQADSEYKYKASYALLSFHHATQDLKPLASWQTILSSVLQSKPDDWLPQFSADNWGLGDKFLLLHGFGQPDSILGNNNDECEDGIGVQPKPDKFEKTDGNIHKSTQSYPYYNKYCPDCQRQMSREYTKLVGAFSGFQPKPAVEVILVVMKPLSEKTYMDQALKNGKGITWLDDGKIPYKGKNDFVISHHNKNLKEKNKSTGIFGATNGFGLLESDISQGRFPANLLASDDVLNNGKISRSGKNRKSNQLQKNQWLKKSIYYDNLNYGDSGSFSRYFDLDKWWREKSKKLSKQPCFICGYVEEHGNYIDADGRTYCDECLISGDYLDIPKLNIRQLPESVRKTYPYLIVPKASKSEKNRGCERLEEKVRASINKMMGEAGNFKTGSGNVRTTKFKNHHPTVKPIKLMSYLIILGSRPNDIILDPFVGSGTTCIAAKMMGRKYIGIDDDKGYVEIAQCRLGAVEPVLI